MIYPANNRGFTLAEMAIVLILIGFLVGFILLGDGMVAQSRIKSLVNDFEGLRVAVLTYTDRYAALPGDDARAATRWSGPGAQDGTGDGRIGGSYQAAPPPGNPATSLVINPATGDGESLNFWWHLRLAQLVVAPPSAITPIAQPLNFYAGVTGVEWAPLGFPRLAVCTANLPGDVAIGVESQLDDGNPRRGLIRSGKQNVSNEAIATIQTGIDNYTVADGDKFVLCRRLD